MTKTHRDILRHRLVWDGIEIEVSYDPDWLNFSSEGSRYATAHLDIQAVTPPDAPLPITETGYRSHFLRPEEVIEAGGPIAYVRAWLDQAATGAAWRRAKEEARQLRLF